MLTPGDIADRLSILSVKMSRMPERQDIKEQFSEMQAEWMQLGVDAAEEYRTLAELNDKAYDVVEMIYADFRDPKYGTDGWFLSFGQQDRAELTIRNCRRAHELNMERVRLKNAINAKAGAAQEVKSW